MGRLTSYPSLMIVGAALAACGPSLRERVQDLTARSTFIVQGTVAEVGAAGSPSIPAFDSNVVIKVDRVLATPPSVGDFAGRSITLRATGREPLRVGERGVFFATGWLLTDHIAVVEVGRVARCRIVCPVSSERQSKLWLSRRSN